MSSESSTDGSRTSGDSGFQPWHFYLLLSMGAATWAVITSRHTHPVALLLISAAAIAAGFVATALHFAISGFFAANEADHGPLTNRRREFLEQEKALVLRSIKELEFDRAMRKIDDKDFAELSGRLRAKAMEIMEELDSSRFTPAPRGPGPGTSVEPAVSGKRKKVVTAEAAPGTCPSCHTENGGDARFCKQCGARL